MAVAYDYNALIDAVTKSYGKEIWQGITSAEDFYSSDFASKITQVDGVKATYLKDGSVAYYTYGDTIVGASTGASNVINSNTGLGSYKSTLEIPAETTVDAAGKVAAESGMKTVSTGSKVTATLGKVAVGVAAVGAGVQLGAAIDSTLYNLNPDFWDEKGMSSLNPQTWDSLVSSQGGKDVFNMVFGINKDNGQTQAYIDQQALAYIAQYLALQGVFSKYTLNDYNISTPNYTTLGKVYGYKVPKVSTLDNDILLTEGLRLTKPDATTQIFVGTLLNEDIYAVPYYVEMDPVQYGYVSDMVLCSKQSISSTSQSHTKVLFYEPADGYTYYSALNQRFSNTTYLNEVINYLPLGRQISESVGSYIYGISSRQNSGATTNYWQLALSVLYGIIHSQSFGGIDGITPQQGATVPSGITSDMSIADVITQLQSLYPNLWDNAISNSVVQEDGTVTDYIYVPVNIPDTVTVTEDGQVQPTGGTDSTQMESALSDTSTDTILNTLLQIISNPEPYRPTDEDTPTDNDYPETGEGLTPPQIIPTGSASALYSIYNPSQLQINDFGAWLWSDNFVDQLLKIFNDPMQAVIGLHKVFATPITSGSGTIKVGYLDSGVGTSLVSNQYTSIDCGTVSLYEYFGNVLDYTQTDIYIYLPFVGIVPLNVSDAMRGDINVSYKVDVLTGACLCSVNISRDLAGGQIYTYSGNCAVQYPLSSGSYMGIVSSMLGIAGSVVSTIASGGAALPLALGVGASAIGSMKTNVEHSGNISGNAGAMGIKTPYLIIRRPQTAIADGFNQYNGISSNKYISLGSCKGFTKVRYANLENIPLATGEEMTQIERQLLNGIII